MDNSRSFKIILSALLAAACGGGDGGGGNPTDPGGFSADCTVPQNAIFDGGVARDAIPALTTPEVVPAANGGFLSDTARVLGMVVNGQARAYPFTVLWWHEVVNDTLGGEPILVTYCPLTGSGIAFDPRVDGQVRNFGVSGLLYRTNLTMFDRTNETLWNQMLLSGMCGLDRGKSLARMPIAETTWAAWRGLHPNTTVMTQNTGFRDRPYGVYPYGAYKDEHNAFISFLTSTDRARITDVRPPKELAIGVLNGSSAKIYPFGVLRNAGAATVVNDVVGATPVLITYVSSGNIALAFDRRVGGQTLTFDLVSAAPLQFTDQETGSTWDATGVATAGSMAGEQLGQIADSYLAFWFAWSVYFPDRELFLN
ncbi:MAG: DUF3179 domain-containing protein [Gemmatimonadales bacterium]